MARVRGTDEKYTVIIQYPQKVLEALEEILPPPQRIAGKTAVYVAHVKARSILDATKEGKHQAMRAQENEHRGELKDWRAVAVLAGHAKVEWVS